MTAVAKKIADDLWAVEFGLLKLGLSAALLGPLLPDIMKKLTVKVPTSTDNTKPYLNKHHVPYTKVETSLDPLQLTPTTAHWVKGAGCHFSRSLVGVDIYSGYYLNIYLDRIDGLSDVKVQSVSISANTMPTTVVLHCKCHCTIPSLQAVLKVNAEVPLLFACEGFTLTYTLGLEASFDVNVDIQLSPQAPPGKGCVVDLNLAVATFSDLKVHVPSSARAAFLAKVDAEVVLLSPLLAEAIDAFVIDKGFDKIEALASGKALNEFQHESKYIGPLLGKALRKYVVQIDYDLARFALGPPSSSPPALTGPNHSGPFQVPCAPYSGWQYHECAECVSGSGSGSSGLSPACDAAAQATCANLSPPFGFCRCDPQCVPGKCQDTCGNLEPEKCCGVDSAGNVGVCNTDTLDCCYPKCPAPTPTNQCGGPNGCGGKCECPAPQDCIYNSTLCGIVSSAYVPPPTSFYATGLSTADGSPVSARFLATSEGAQGAVLLAQCDPVVAPGVNRLTVEDVAAGPTAGLPTQRITYWSVQCFEDNSSSYVLSCFVKSIGVYRANSKDAQPAGPFYLVDPTSPTLFPAGNGSLLSATATLATAAVCTLTPHQPKVPDPEGRTFVLITAVVGQGTQAAWHTLADAGGEVAWVPGTLLPGQGLRVLWLFGGCQSDADCAGGNAPFCQVGNTCGGTPTYKMTGIAPGVLCSAACQNPARYTPSSLPAAWAKLGFPFLGPYIGAPDVADAQGVCECQGWQTPFVQDGGVSGFDPFTIGSGALPCPGTTTAIYGSDPTVCTSVPDAFSPAGFFSTALLTATGAPVSALLTMEVAPVPPAFPPSSVASSYLVDVSTFVESSVSLGSGASWGNGSSVFQGASSQASVGSGGGFAPFVTEPPAVNLQTFDLGVAAGVNVLTPNVVIPPQRITYWAVSAVGQGLFTISCFVDSIAAFLEGSASTDILGNSSGSSGSLGSLGSSELSSLPSAATAGGPYFLVDPNAGPSTSNNNLGLMSSQADPEMAVKCSLTVAAPVPGSRAVPGRTLVRITAMLSTGQSTLMTQAPDGRLAWVPGTDTSVDSLWFFGTCVQDEDCDASVAPYCQVGGQCGAEPTFTLGGNLFGSSCAEVCATPSLFPAALLASWKADGFTGTGLLLGAATEADTAGNCQCQALKNDGVVAGKVPVPYPVVSHNTPKSWPWWAWLVLALAIVAVVLAVVLPCTLGTKRKLRHQNLPIQTKK